MDKGQTGRQAAEGDDTTGYHTMQRAGAKWGSVRQMQRRLGSAKPETEASAGLIMSKTPVKHPLELRAKPRLLQVGTYVLFRT